MSKTFLKRLFQAYYHENIHKMKKPNCFQQREFAFIPWDKEIMIRHVGFNKLENLKNFLITNIPQHVYSSGSLYEKPNNSQMSNKGYLGCDLIIDIDVDHFFTPCKKDHDLWICKNCNEYGYGMKSQCSKCGSVKLDTLNWICTDCLEIAKNEIVKLLYNFLIPDFGINQDEMKVAFSGHRGYHLKVENKKIRSLSSDERRDLADYLTGHNISFQVLGLKKIGYNIYGLMKENFGWSQKIVLKIEEILKTYSDSQIHDLLDRFGLNENVITSFINSRNLFLNTITNQKNNLWNVEGFGIKNWEIFLKGIVGLIGIKIDEPVTIDIHRLIRYPNSLHGKTGFKVVEIPISELKYYNPLNNEKNTLDPIVFYSDSNTQKIKITSIEVPQTSIRGETFGPYKKGEVIEVPNHIAIFLLAKEVAVVT